MTDPGFKNKSALVVGMGGLGCPAALALARAGVGQLVLCDDDRVELTNLHRQILYTDADVGRDKLEAARDALQKEGATDVRLERRRLLPENASELVKNVDIVLEGADNFATKFLAADACYLSATPVIHGAAVRWRGTAWSVGPTGKPCYRCLFEDLLPDDQAPNCSEAGVFGPVVGIVGALMADLALDVLQGTVERRGTIFNVDGKKQEVRAVSVRRRSTCPLCGESSPFGRISRLSRNFYTSTGPLEARLTQLNA